MPQICQKIKKMLNSALLLGFSSIQVDTLTKEEREELEYCGYRVIPHTGNTDELYYIISQ